MRNCPVCQLPNKKELWTMEYKIPDGWPVPSLITWNECTDCGMIYGDGDISQEMLDEYYHDYYGYGVDLVTGNIERLLDFANEIAKGNHKKSRVVDFGGGDGWFIKRLKELGFTDTFNIHVNDPLPDGVDILFASHVIEHIYDLPDAMERITACIKPGGILVIDGPDTMGIYKDWRMPMQDWNTKHINHFTLTNYLDLGRQYGFTAESVEHYRLGGAWSWRVLFRKGFDLGAACRDMITSNMERYVKNLKDFEGKRVNIWGLGDITWHILSRVNLDVQNYIDNDPAYRGKTYNGKPVLEKPDNNWPILILAQGQRELLIKNILEMRLENRVIEI